MHHRFRRVAVLATLLAILAAVIAPPARAQDQSPDISSLVEPSVVYLGIGLRAKIRYPTVKGGSSVTDDLTIGSRCTGFFVSTEGHIVTAGHCVNPGDYRADFIEAGLEWLVKKKYNKPSEIASVRDYANETWKIGKTEMAIGVTQPTAVSGAVKLDDKPALRRSVRGFDTGDIALLKIDVTGTKPLPLATQDPPIGTPVTAVGYAASVSDVSDDVRPSFKAGRVSSRQAKGGVPRIEVDAPITGGMSGGPAVDGLGNVLGVNSSKLIDEQAFNFITDTTELNEFLRANGITPVPARTPPPPPRPAPVAKSGSPLPLILLGLGLLLAVVVVVLLLRRRGAPKPPEGPGQSVVASAAAPTWADQPPAPPPAPMPSRPAGAPAADAPTAELTGVCGSCGAGNTPGARFCSNCGASLS